jgi:hypothetical protein
VLAKKGFATALKSECTSDPSEKDSQNPNLDENLTNAKIPVCFPEQAKDCGGKERRGNVFKEDKKRG